MKTIKWVILVFAAIGTVVFTLTLLAAHIYIVWLTRPKASTKPDSFYNAGVVEFAPAKYQSSTLNQLNDNLREYIKIINSDEAENLDIIVFPELTLNNAQHLTDVPEPKTRTIPCNNQRFKPFLRDLSCAAKYTRKYVVINLLEEEYCSASSQAAKNDPRPCAPNGLSQFNTNVAFDRNGAVIARYRKYNSYDLTLNVTYEPELSTFDTDFGVKFGMFICFDMNFYSPAQELVDMGVTDFIYSSFWFSELPFLTANQLQQSWAYANNVNLLAAGASNPSGGTTGSGIFSGRLGALTSVMADKPERKLYTARVPKSGNDITSESLLSQTGKHSGTKRSNGGISLMREYRMGDFSSQLLEFTTKQLNVEKNLCHGEFCCQFNLKLSRNTLRDGAASYKYHLAVFDGDRKYSGFGYTKYKFCAVYACTDESLDSCGRVFNAGEEVRPETVFESISIEGVFPNTEKVLIMPNTLDQDLLPLSTDRFEFVVGNERKSQDVKLRLLTPADDLLTFGIYANYYDN